MEPTGHVVKLFDSSALISFCVCEDLDLLQGKSVGLICIIKAKHQYFITMAHVGMFSIVICVHNLKFTAEGKAERQQRHSGQLSDSLKLQILQ